MSIRLGESAALLAVLTVLAGADAASAQKVPGAAAPPPPDARRSLVAAAVELAAAPLAADHPEAPGRGELSQEQPWWVKERRACEGCPRRSVGKALLEATFIVNGLAEAGNLIRGQATAHITPKTWWTNMKQGWVWDLDDFGVNQIGHPYQGNAYFNSGRANGLSFYESAAVAAFGSATWEYFGETNYPSINDFINTTLGGAALGEMFHRAGWLVRDTRATGRTRLWREIGAMAIDPMTGLNRFLTHDSSRVVDKPADLVPASLDGFFSVGALFRGSNTEWVKSAGEPFLEADLLYGDPWTGRSRTPYEAFLVRLRFGGGAGFSEARVRGRLLGQPFGHDRGQFMVNQNYDYQANDAFHYGAQSFNALVGWTSKPTSSISVWFGGWGGITILGAVDSLPLGLDEVPPETPESEAGQGVAEGPRYYDYGPGGYFGAFATLYHNGRTFVSFAYDSRHIYSLNGVRANHLLHQARLDLLAPIHRKLGIGVSGEYFDRRTFYQDTDHTVKRYHYPQFRVYFTWSMS